MQQANRAASAESGAMAQTSASCHDLEAAGSRRGRGAPGLSTSRTERRVANPSMKRRPHGRGPIFVANRQPASVLGIRPTPRKAFPATQPTRAVLTYSALHCHGPRVDDGQLSRRLASSEAAAGGYRCAAKKPGPSRLARSRRPTNSSTESHRAPSSASTSRRCLASSAWTIGCANTCGSPSTPSRRITW